MRRDELYVADLVDSTRVVREYLDGISREQWDEDRVLRDAILYRLLLLGEIASALPEALRDRYPDVAWRKIRAFRNLAVHKYFSVDWAVVWQIAQEEMPVLEEQAMDIMRADFPELAKTYELETAAEPGTEDVAGPGQDRLSRRRMSRRCWTGRRRSNRVGSPGSSARRCSIKVT
jgi:uncharacterized protein with HEPN domain